MWATDTWLRISRPPADSSTPRKTLLSDLWRWAILEISFGEMLERWVKIWGRSYSLTTRLSRRKEGVIVSWLIVLRLWLFLYPLGLPIGSEVASDLNSELSGLNNLCSSTFLASIVLYSKSRRRKQNEHVDLPAHTSPHKHSVTVGLELSSLE